MNGKPCASTDKTQSWETIDWKQASAYVKKLQMRIVKAQKRRSLQQGKILAVAVDPLILCQSTGSKKGHK